MSVISAVIDGFGEMVDEVRKLVDPFTWKVAVVIERDATHRLELVVSIREENRRTIKREKST